MLFDLDGVLVDSAATVERHYRAFAARHGVDADALLQGLPGRPMADVLAAAVPSLCGDDLAAELARFEAAEASDTDDLRAIPHATELLDALRDAPWAVVTSGTRPVAEARLAAVGIAPPAVLVTADQVARGKPSPEPYRRAANALGIDPARCLVVEDAPAGITAGREAGATVIAVASTVPVDRLAAAHHVVETLAQLQLSVDPATGGIRAAIRAPADAPPARRSDT